METRANLKGNYVKQRKRKVFYMIGRFKCTKNMYNYIKVYIYIPYHEFSNRF